MVKSDEEQRIENEAIAYAKQHRAEIAKKLTALDLHPPEANPVSVFMAGSPGAGKTETSQALLSAFEANDGFKILRIDPDELRHEFPAYTGGNAWLFQKAVARVVDRILDEAFKKEQSFLLDGTLSSFKVADKNIQRALGKHRLVQILYVYQDPAQAWVFVQAREAMEGRRILPETFIEQYFSSRQVVNHLKQIYGKKIRVDLLFKNIDGSTRVYKDNVDNVDNHIPEKYDVSSLERLLGISKC